MPLIRKIHTKKHNKTCEVDAIAIARWEADATRCVARYTGTLIFSPPPFPPQADKRDDVSMTCDG